MAEKPFLAIKTQEVISNWLLWRSAVQQDVKIGEKHLFWSWSVTRARKSKENQFYMINFFLKPLPSFSSLIPFCLKLFKHKCCSSNITGQVQQGRHVLYTGQQSKNQPLPQRAMVFFQHHNVQRWTTSYCLMPSIYVKPPLESVKSFDLTQWLGLSMQPLLSECARRSVKGFHPSSWLPFFFQVHRVRKGLCFAYTLIQKILGQERSLTGILHWTVWASKILFG